MTMTESVTRLLKVSDRCDACGAQAFFLVELKTGELTFCRHHFSKHEESLLEIAVDVYDESDVLTAPKRPVFEED